MFQYQHGPINTRIRIRMVIYPIEFQYQHGPINTVLSNYNLCKYY